MPREVNSTQPYSDKLVKLIPTEIVGAYMVLAGILGFVPDPTSMGPAAAPPTGSESALALLIPRVAEPDLKRMLIQVVFFVLLAFTPAYLWKISRVRNTAQLVVTTITFAVWVYTLGGPFIVWGVYYPLVGSVVLVLWSLTIPLVVTPNGLRKAKAPQALAG